MHQIKVHSFINRLIQLFYRFGLWDKDSGKFEFGRKLFHFLYVLAFLASVIAGTYFSDDKNETVYLIAAGLVIFVNIVRTYKLIVEKNSIVAFLQYFGCHSTCDSEEFSQINKKLTNFVKVALIFVFFTVIATCCTVVLPVVSKEKIMIINIGFPLDWRNSSSSFWIAHVFIVVGTMHMLFCVIFSIIIWYLMLNCAVKYEVLGNQLRKLGVLKITSETSVLEVVKVLEKENGTLFLKELIEAIKSHRNINRMLDGFSECFEDVFFIQIGTSGIGICGSIFNLIFSDANLFQNAIYYILALYCIFDIFIVMLLGNKIKESSDRLSYCLFESDWIGESNGCKKVFIIMSEVLKQPRQIIICKLYPLNLETFLAILHGAYSMFNILLNLK